MIKKLVRQMLTAQILSALTVSLCLLIDNMVVGRFLGVRGLAAYGLANPVLLVIGAVGSMLSAGVQVVCSRSLGKGSQEETNAGYSTAIAMAAAVSAAFVVLVMAFRGPLARAMGAGSDPVLYGDTKDYMAGFIIGAPASVGALILVPFLQMAGKSGLLIAAVLGMTVSDVAFDLLSVLVFHGGMFGIGLASALSYYVAAVVGGSYFLSSRCVFRFSPRRVTRAKAVELLAGGVPMVFNMASSVVLVYAMNKILMHAGGAVAVAAYSVISTISNTCNCISTGMGGVSLTLCGLFFNEEDRSSLRQLTALLMRHAAVLGIVVVTLLQVFAPACVRLFLPDPGQTRDLAVWGLRIYAVSMIPCCVISVLRNGYQGVDRVRMTEVISVMQNAALPVLIAFILSRAVPIAWIWIYSLIAELVTLGGILGYVWLKRRGDVRHAEDLLLLPDGFGVAPEDMLEADVRDMDGLMAASRAAGALCRAKGGAPKLGERLALCVEEMGGNIITYGFSDGGEHHLSIRLQHKSDHWSLRFRDDCSAFDPVGYMTENDAPAHSGIRLALQLADEVRYTNSLNLNNLTLILRDE